LDKYIFGLLTFGQF